MRRTILTLAACASLALVGACSSSDDDPGSVPELSAKIHRISPFMGSVFDQSGNLDCRHVISESREGYAARAPLVLLTVKLPSQPGTQQYADAKHMLEAIYDYCTKHNSPN